ncbi:MAG: histidine kinase [Bacteroidetes bacterium]|nr:histidine kinase [Bacteroidota bacterium]
MLQGNTIFRWKLHHLLFWAALLGLWYFFRYEDYSSGWLAFKVTLLKVADLAFMVYVTNYVLIPKLLYKKKYVLFGVVWLLFIMASSWLKIFIEGHLVHHPELFDITHHFKGRFYDNTIPHILLVSTGAAFKLLLDYASAQKRMAEMARENAAAELNFLKSQINPHFVFNSLNSVYFLIDRQNAPARDSLEKFSDMLRYQLYECGVNQIGIEKEVDYLKDYIDLQRLRRDENCRIDLQLSPELNGFQIAPLLLIPFVENAFKHLSHFSERSNDVSIRLERENGSLNLWVSNTREEKGEEGASGAGANPGGIGLPNVQRRLELLYPGKHTLVIDKFSDRFDIFLKLEI